MILDRKLEIFLVVSELGSFSRAARRLSMSQSAVSFHVHSLEKALGVKLFERRGRTIALTPEGECLEREGKNLASGAKRLQDALSDLSATIAQHIHLAGDALMCAFTFPWALVEFREANPGAQLVYEHLDRDTLVARLLSGELDLGLVGYPLRHRKLESQVCFSSDIVLVGASGADQGAVDLDALRSLPLLWCTGDKGVELLLSQKLSDIGVPPKELNIVMEVEDLSLLKTAVEAQIGCAFLPELTVANELESGILKRLDLSGFLLEQTTYLLGRRENHREIVRQFWDFVRLRRERALDERQRCQGKPSAVKAPLQTTKRTAR